METSAAIKKRRAVKYFDPNFTISKEEEQSLLSLAMLAPTAFNIQNWRFVLVKDPQLRKIIRAVSWDQPQVTEASLLIILCADVKSWNKNPQRYWEHVPKEAQDFIVPAIAQYYGGREWVQRDEAMRSCGMAAQTIMLAASEMGYDSCPMDGFDYDAVGKLINLPEDHVVSMFVAVGKAAKEAWPRGGKLPYDEVVIENTFS